MTTGKTKSGFEFEFDEKLLNDWEYISNVGVLMDDTAEPFDQVNALNRSLKTVLGPKQAKALSQHVRDLNGGVAVTTEVMKELNEIVSYAKASKN